LNCHILAVNIDLKDAIDQLPQRGQLVERAPEKSLLLRALDVRDNDDKAGVKRLHRIEPAEITGVVRDQHKISVAGMARDVPVLPAGFADTGDMLSLMPCLASNRNQIDAQTPIDQKPHAASIVASFRRRL
jgi:hypothetical protein